MNRPLRKLPDPTALPYRLATITVWEQDTHDPDLYRGTEYANAVAWENTRNAHDTLDQNTEYPWTFNGFRLDYFTRGYLPSPSNEQPVPPLVSLAMWALEKWAVHAGLQEKPRQG